MSKRGRIWPFVFRLFALLAILGLSFAFNIVQRDGLDGLWHRKNALIDKTQPGAGPLLDEAEKRFRGKQDAGR